ncbi:hypothetical protein [Streptomyces sp. AP-93]|uniref:hypothetical protein n=1 Tax=Streptomyces sp. AP-93 TaxID=2929048 RepID=UPI001FB046D0|nr:hypothetical protein [Streptomyces sp. AP-93]MCJ0869772.1 hypothetical protein [Streptomyces sp. AP-93]
MDPRQTVTSVLLAAGILSAGLAVAQAGAALWGPAVKGRSAHALRGAAVAVTRTVVLPLRRLYSGRVGDCTSWLAVGTALLIAAFAVRP